MNGSTGERPYRSHLQPACLPCRRRKSRCQTESDATACLMCRAHGTDCVYPGDAKVDDQSQRAAASGNVKASTTTPAKRRRRSSGLPKAPISASRTSRTDLPPRLPVTTVSPTMERTRLPNLLSPLPPITHTQPPATAAPATTSIAGRTNHNLYDQDPFDSSADDQAQNLHIVGPAVTKDSQVLSDYLSAIPGATRGTQMIVPVPANRSRPVLFTRVQKRPLGVSLNRSPSAEKLEIIENLVGADAADMISLYFAKVNSCFPILDEVLFRRQHQANKDRISPALIATLFAHILVYWRHSKPEGQHRLPDSRFIWNLANDAVYSELHLSPGMSIIKAIILNIGGLPTTSLIGNGVLLGSAVSMALSLGLNHNPLPWEIPQIEKCLRMKIWWALLVHDRWTSLAHGTPPHISRAQYDVPPPTLEYTGDSAPYLGQNFQAAPVFIALVSLTDVLDKHLQYIYSVDKSTPRDTTELELALNTWVESLSGTVRLIILRGSNLDTPGASNLRLSYLTTRLLLQRIELEADKQNCEAHDQRLSNRYIQGRRTAEEILLFTQDLKPAQLGDFWLSTHAFSYPATVSFLLRCGLETASSPADLVQSASFRIAHELLNALRTHQEQHAWELGAVCLAQHSDIVDKILAGTSAHESHETSGMFEPQDYVLPDVSIIDQFLPSLWDPLQNAW